MFLLFVYSSIPPHISTLKHIPKLSKLGTGSPQPLGNSLYLTTPSTIYSITSLCSSIIQSIFLSFPVCPLLKPYSLIPLLAELVENLPFTTLSDFPDLHFLCEQDITRIRYNVLFK